jgi:hypothetical protein
VENAAFYLKGNLSSGMATTIPSIDMRLANGIPFETSAVDSSAYKYLKEMSKVETYEDKIKLPFPRFFESMTSHNTFRSA